MEMQSPKSKEPTVVSRAMTNGGPRGPLETVGWGCCFHICLRVVDLSFTCFFSTIKLHERRRIIVWPLALLSPSSIATFFAQAPLVTTKATDHFLSLYLLGRFRPCMTHQVGRPHAGMGVG